MADVFSDPSKKSFWRRHTAALPGSVKPVESKTGATNMVFGAQHTYGEMLAPKVTDKEKKSTIGIKAEIAGLVQAALRQLSWSGISDELRPMAWQLLLGYLPCNSDRRVATLARKRKEYEDSVSQAYSRGISGLDQTIWHQCLERILYVWAIRHPANENPEIYDPSNLPKEVLNVIEADSFWCLSKLLDGIQAEGTDGFSEFHLYVCAAFLVKWSDKIRSMDFQGIMMFLQSLPTSNWGEKEIELLVSEAYMWKTLFHNAPSHLLRT
ncbi:26_t:CDS:10 [Diversispora eburnea]|uniref:26_t:CDS:1 n=1 Tax=Diversispora eburnea TaxID=1213867 RepID=A0A9N8Z442_9GLOM|nr:26_t:CDS:10 [Diversispora eburnea]